MSCFAYNGLSLFILYINDHNPFLEVNKYNNITNKESVWIVLVRQMLEICTCDRFFIMNLVELPVYNVGIIPREFRDFRNIIANDKECENIIYTTIHEILSRLFYIINIIGMSFYRFPIYIPESPYPQYLLAELLFMITGNDLKYIEYGFVYPNIDCFNIS